jgi:mitogen-activated protein kinase kinase 1
MYNNPKKFTLNYEDLVIGDIIGRGASSVVLHGVHAPTGTPLALKVINLFDRSKREQLIREIVTLYDAQCTNLITFYGAFYREGSITIALEYMDGGSLSNVLDQVGPIPEAVLANMAFQILWGLAYLKHDKRVHRDLKPSNLLINAKGEVKVIFLILTLSDNSHGL